MEARHLRKRCLLDREKSCIWRGNHLPHRAKCQKNRHGRLERACQTAVENESLKKPPRLTMNMMPNGKSRLIAGAAFLLSAFMLWEFIPRKSFSILDRCIYASMKRSFTNGEYAHAQSSIDWLLKRHPINKDLIFNKACICIKQNDWLQARLLLKDVILMSPTDIEAKRWFAIAVAHTGGTDELLSNAGFLKDIGGQIEGVLPTPLY
jgi:hypothetical protein